MSALGNELLNNFKSMNQGVNVVVASGATHAVIASATFNVYNDSTASDRLLEFLVHQVPNRAIAVVVAANGDFTGPSDGTDDGGGEGEEGDDDGDSLCSASNMRGCDEECAWMGCWISEESPAYLCADHGGCSGDINVWPGGCASCCETTTCANDGNSDHNDDHNDDDDDDDEEGSLLLGGDLVA